MDKVEDTPGHSVRRSTSRLRLRLAAYADLHAGTVRVVLCDISQGGAKVFAHAALPVGRDLLLRWGPHEAFGTVVWERDGLRGVQFDELLPASALIATRDMQDAGGLGRDGVAEWVSDKGWDFGKALN
jgi:hypothetical protein